MVEMCDFDPAKNGEVIQPGDGQPRMDVSVMHDEIRNTVCSDPETRSSEQVAAQEQSGNDYRRRGDGVQKDEQIVPLEYSGPSCTVMRTVYRPEDAMIDDTMHESRPELHCGERQEKNHRIDQHAMLPGV